MVEEFKTIHKSNKGQQTKLWLSYIVQSHVFSASKKAVSLCSLQESENTVGTSRAHFHMKFYLFLKPCPKSALNAQSEQRLSWPCSWFSRDGPKTFLNILSSNILFYGLNIDIYIFSPSTANGKSGSYGTLPQSSKLPRKPVSVLGPIVRTFWLPLCWGTFTKFVYDALGFVNPQILM